MADKAQTWVYTEDYVAESDALTAARAVATEMGATPVSPGRVPPCACSPPCRARVLSSRSVPVLAFQGCGSSMVWPPMAS